MADKVAVIGSGLIGKSWAMVFVSAGYRVCLFDIDTKQTTDAMAYIRDQLSQLESQTLLRGNLSADEQMALVTVSNDLRECVENAVYIQECTPELLDLKKKVFLQLDEWAPEGVPIVSSSSAMLPSTFTEGMKKRSQAMVGHPINPPYFVPLVELVPAPWTDAALVDKAFTTLCSAGQVPVKLKKEVPGFAVVRTQNAIIMEALRLVLDGVMSVEDVDKVMCHGLGMRYAFMGPYETAHLNADGMESYYDRYNDMIHSVASDSGPAVSMDPTSPSMRTIQEGLQEFSPVEDLAARRRWRDVRVAALAKIKQRMDSADKQS